jgi:hypothetical protein
MIEQSMTMLNFLVKRHVTTNHKQQRRLFS